MFEMSVNDLNDNNGDIQQIRKERKKERHFLLLCFLEYKHPMSEGLSFLQFNTIHHITQGQALNEYYFN